MNLGQKKEHRHSSGGAGCSLGVKEDDQRQGSSFLSPVGCWTLCGLLLHVEIFFNRSSKQVEKKKVTLTVGLSLNIDTCISIYLYIIFFFFSNMLK